MAEFTNVGLQTILPGQNVIFTETPVFPTRCIVHREGSGIVRLKGMTNQNRSRYLIAFSGNIQIPTGGTVEEISLAISLDGEPLPATQMIVTPAAVENFFNVSAMTYVDALCGCCVTVGVENTSTQDIEVQNANLIVTRVA